MKKLKLSRKSNTIIGLIVVILLIIIITLVSLQPFSPAQVLPEQKLGVAFPTVTTSINNPNQFIWQIDHLQLPSKIEIVSVKQTTQAEDIFKKISSNLGFTGNLSSIPKSSVVFYNNPTEATEIYLNISENLIKFNLNLLEKSIPKDTDKKEIISILQESLNLPSSISIVKNSTHYQTLDGPRFINTTQNKATLVSSTYNYSLNTLPILFPKGNSIETTHSLSGKLVKLSLNLPLLPAPTGAGPYSLPVKTIEEIKNTPNSKFVTIMLTGNDKFILSDQEINIEEAVINNGFLGYIYTQNTLAPHIFLTGTTEDQVYGQIELLLAIPATE